MYTIRMDSASVINSMPYVFRTREFGACAGIQMSSASRTLRAAADAGTVSKVGQGLWRRSDRDAPAAKCSAPHPFPPAWMNDNECLLNAVFGTAPRRISHMMALEAAGVPLVVGPQMSFPQEQPVTALPLGIKVFREPRNRVPAFATRLTEHTWMSSPTRAAIETAQHDVASPLWEERIAWVFAEDNGAIFDTEEAVEISDSLQMRAGLRRLSSIAHALRYLATTDPDDPMRNIPETWADVATAQRGDAWIRLRRSKQTLARPSEAAWADNARKVMWDRHPKTLAVSLMT